jgi:hypothetical protein
MDSDHVWWQNQILHWILHPNALADIERKLILTGGMAIQKPYSGTEPWRTSWQIKRKRPFHSQFIISATVWLQNQNLHQILHQNTWADIKKKSILTVSMVVWNFPFFYIFGRKTRENPWKSVTAHIQNGSNKYWKTPTRTRILRWFQIRFDPGRSSSASCRTWVLKMALGTIGKMSTLPTNCCNIFAENPGGS